MKNTRVSAEVTKALYDSFTLQCIPGIIAWITVDAGILIQIWAFSMAAYWAGAVVIMLRRAKNATRVDVAFIKWGFLVLCLVVTPAFSVLIWRLRGVIER